MSQIFTKEYFTQETSMIILNQSSNIQRIKTPDLLQMVCIGKGYNCTLRLRGQVRVIKIQQITLRALPG